MGKFKKETDELTRKLNEMLVSVDDISKKVENTSKKENIDAVIENINSVSDNLHRLIKIKDNADGVVIFCGLGSISTASALTGAWIHSKPTFYIGAIGTIVSGYYLVDNMMQLRDRTGTLNIIEVYKKTNDDIQKIEDDIVVLQNNIIDIRQDWMNPGAGVDAAESRLQEAEDFLSSLGTDGLSDIVNDEDTEAAQEIINKVKSFEDENRDDEFLIDDDNDDDSDDDSDDSDEDTPLDERDVEINADTATPEIVAE